MRANICPNEPVPPVIRTVVFVHWSGPCAVMTYIRQTARFSVGLGRNSELMPPDELLHNSSRCGCRLPAFPTSGWITQALAPIGDALLCLAFPFGVFFVHHRAKHAVMTFKPLNVFG